MLEVTAMSLDDAMEQIENVRLVGLCWLGCWSWRLLLCLEDDALEHIEDCAPELLGRQ